MKKKLKIGVGFFIFINILIFYYVLDCRFYSRFSYRSFGSGDLVWSHVCLHMDTIQDSIIDWKPVMKQEPFIEIISINNKKKSLEFYLIDKREKEISIKYYVNGKLFKYYSNKGAERYYHISYR